MTERMQVTMDVLEKITELLAHVRAGRMSPATAMLAELEAQFTREDGLMSQHYKNRRWDDWCSLNQWLDCLEAEGCIQEDTANAMREKLEGLMPPCEHSEI